MRLTSIVTLSAALLLSSAAVAQDKKLAANEQAEVSTNYQTTADQAAGVSQAPAEKKICKRLETSGTRMFQKVCLTKSEWEKVEEDAK